MRRGGPLEVHFGDQRFVGQSSAADIAQHQPHPLGIGGLAVRVQEVELV